MRTLIAEQLIPHDVTIQVLTQSRDDLIDRTFEALLGAPRAIVHLYNATAPMFRDIVFRQDKAATVALAVNGARAFAGIARLSPIPPGASSIRRKPSALPN